MTLKSHLIKYKIAENEDVNSYIIATMLSILLKPAYNIRKPGVDTANV